jgi:DNA-binding NarL/FixJ family response regulator
MERPREWESDSRRFEADSSRWTAHARTMSARLILADDHLIVREGLKSLVSSLPGLEVVGEAGHGRKALELVERLRPHLVIMDVGMPELNGIEATRLICAMDPSVRVIGLSMHADPRYVSNMLHVGARGYLLKQSAFEELAEAIKVVLCGRIYLSPAVQGEVAEARGGPLATQASKVLGTLTGREREILQLVAEGASGKEMSTRLGISLKTVDTHRQHLMEKLGIRSVAQLTKYAIREGLTQLED